MNDLKKNNNLLAIGLKFKQQTMRTTLKTVMVLFLSITLFSCNKDDDNGPSIATLTTAEVTDTSPTAAMSGGNVTDAGGADITVKGVCWGTTAKPTIADSKTDEGSGSGVFTSILTGLTANATYYVRAYATNSEGTAYGNEHTFIAKGVFPGETVNVTGGTFKMGSTTGYTNEKPIHNVALSDFSMSKYEITNAQYAIFMNAIAAPANGSVEGVEYLGMDATSIQISYANNKFTAHTGKEKMPVVEVSWFGAKAYAKYYGGRLPTEAEWEYAARGGTSNNGYTYSGSNTIDDVAWYRVNSGRQTHTVGTKTANELGLYDMSGNVWEWCSDWYKVDYYSNSPANDPQGLSSGTYRVVRGGGWRFVNGCCVANRGHDNPTNTHYNVGFRPVFMP